MTKWKEILQNSIRDAASLRKVLNLTEEETILKGTTMRKEIEKTVMETIENPLLQTKWQELIKKSGEPSSSSEKGGSEGDKKKQEGESGEDGGSS